MLMTKSPISMMKLWGKEARQESINDGHDDPDVADAEDIDNAADLDGETMLMVMLMLMLRRTAL